MELALNETLDEHACICSDMTKDQYSTEYAQYNLIVIIGLLPVISSFGLTTNLISLFIYTRPSQRSSCSFYLAALSCSDFFLVLTGLALFWMDSARTYLPFLKYTPYFMIYSLPVGYIAQTCSVYLTVFAALDCYIGLKWSKILPNWCTERSSKIIIGLVLMGSVAYNGVRFSHYKLRSCLISASNEWMLEICPSSLFMDMYYVYHMYMYMTFIVVIPFFLLIVLIVLILNALPKESQQRPSLCSISAVTKNSSAPFRQQQHQKSSLNFQQQQQQRVRTQSTPAAAANNLTAAEAVLTTTTAIHTNTMIQHSSSLPVNSRHNNNDLIVANGHVCRDNNKTAVCPSQSQTDEAKAKLNSEDILTDDAADYSSAASSASVLMKALTTINDNDHRRHEDSTEKLMISTSNADGGSQPLNGSVFYGDGQPMKTPPVLEREKGLSSNDVCCSSPTEKSLLVNHFPTTTTTTTVAGKAKTKAPVAAAVVTLTTESNSDQKFTLIFVVMLFLSCNSLALIINFYEGFFTPDNLVLNYLTDASNFLVIFNSSVNFIIYMVFAKNYRRAVLSYFCSVHRPCGSALFGKSRKDSTDRAAKQRQLSLRTRFLNAKRRHAALRRQRIAQKTAKMTLEIDSHSRHEIIFTSNNNSNNNNNTNNSNNNGNHHNISSSSSSSRNCNLRTRVSNDTGSSTGITSTGGPTLQIMKSPTKLAARICSDPQIRRTLVNSVQSAESGSIVVLKSPKSPKTVEIISTTTKKTAAQRKQQKQSSDNSNCRQNGGLIPRWSSFSPKFSSRSSLLTARKKMDTGCSQPITTLSPNPSRRFSSNNGGTTATGGGYQSIESRPTDRKHRSVVVSEEISFIDETSESGAECAPVLEDLGDDTLLVVLKL